jgi:osmotically-inducible protein OsmY
MDVLRTRWFRRMRPRSVTDMQNDLARTIAEELRHEPVLDASRVHAAVRNDEITLLGAVRSYAGKCRAETVARSLPGVKEVHNDLEVRLTVGDYRTDAGLTHLANELLENHVAFPGEPPRALVEGGWVTLRGFVASEFQMITAESVIQWLAGVRGITNEIRVNR